MENYAGTFCQVNHLESSMEEMLTLGKERSLPNIKRNILRNIWGFIWALR